MRIYERNDYGLDEIINQIKTDFGFIYTKTDELTGYIVLGEGTQLNLTFDIDNKLENATLQFPSNSLDLTDGNIKAEIYLSSIDSSLQIVNLIKQMTGEEGYNEKDKADTEVNRDEEAESHIRNDEMSETND